MYLALNPSSPLKETKYHIHANPWMYNSYYITNKDKTKVYSTGRNENKQCLRRDPNTYKFSAFSRSESLGHANMLDIQEDRNVEGKKVLKFSCGWAHIIILTDAYKCYSHGYNVYGQCTVKYHQNTDEWTYIHSLDKYKVIDVFSGNLHNIFVTQHNGLFASGLNGSGQLGIGKTERSVKTAEKVLLNSVLYETISCGGTFTLFFMKNRDLYYAGMLNGKSARIPTAISKMSKIPGRIVRIACGNSFFHILSSNGKMYGMGESQYGGHGSGFRMPGLLDETTDFSDIVDVKCGYEFTIFLRRNGEVYGFGRDNDGQLGYKNSRFDFSRKMYRAKRNVRTKGKAVFIKKNISEIFAGRMYTVMVSHKECIYACGYNKFCGLGIDVKKRDKNIYTPTKNHEIQTLGGVARTNYISKSIKQYQKKLLLCVNYLNVVIKTI